MKKTFLVLFLIALIAISSGCGTKKINQQPPQTEKINTVKVQIDSEPEGAFVLIDGMERGTTPFTCEVEAGKHTLTFLKENYYKVVKNPVNIDEDNRTFSAKLKKSDAFDIFLSQGGQSEIVFDSVPVLASFNCGGYFPYSGIFYGGTYTISGKANIDSFDIVFPSGKKVRFDIAKTGKFSKVVKFDETGSYKIVTSTGHTYVFGVDYKATILPPTPQIKDIFTKTYYKNAIAVPLGKDTEAKVLITDAANNAIKNKPLGVFGLKTDDSGIVKFRVKIARSIFNSTSTYKMYINGKLLPSAYANIYANLLAIPYGEAIFTKTGHIISSSIPEISTDIDTVPLDGDVYVPYNFFGGSGLDCWYGICDIKNPEIISPLKNPSVIYTSNSVSEDDGAHWRNTYFFQTIAADPEHPNIIYGYSFSNPFGIGALFKSEDYGKHFVPVFKPEGIITQIAVNTKRVYLVTSNGLLVSEDGVKTLKPCDFNGGKAEFIAVNLTNPDELLVSSDKGVFRTTDNCKTFEKLAFPDNAGTVICMATNKNAEIIYAGTASALFVSENGGKTWKETGKFFIFGKESIAINPMHPNIVYLFDAKRGVYKSQDYGKHFSKIGFPVNACNVGIAVNAKGELFANADCVPFKFENGNFVPMGKDTILRNGPLFKIINGKFYISVKSINLPDMRGIVNDREAAFYVVYPMTP